MLGAMPVVIEFGHTDKLALYEQFCDIQQLMSHIDKKLVEGQLWVEVTHVMVWGHMKACPK